MEHDEKLRMIERMKRFGGSFTKSLADCFMYADSLNVKRLADAFPELVETYGDDGPFSTMGK